MHDLFEGIIPVEIALCVSVFISKKYLSLNSLNTAILNFPYKWGDRTNRPHIVPHAYASNTSFPPTWCRCRAGALSGTSSARFDQNFAGAGAENPAPARLPGVAGPKIGHH